MGVSPSSPGDADVVTRYVYSGSRIVEERDKNGNTLASYVYGRGLDEPIAMLRDVDDNGTPEYYYYHNDLQNNTYFLSDANGQIVEAYTYGTALEPYVKLDNPGEDNPGDTILNCSLLRGLPTTPRPRP